MLNSVLFQKLTIFAISKNTDKNFVVIYVFYVVYLIESLKVVLINMIAILIMSAKLATAGFLRAHLS